MDLSLWTGFVISLVLGFWLSMALSSLRTLVRISLSYQGTRMIGEVRRRVALTALPLLLLICELQPISGAVL